MRFYRREEVAQLVQEPDELRQGKGVDDVIKSPKVNTSYKLTNHHLSYLFTILYIFIF